jgi:hypothetical protein
MIPFGLLHRQFLTAWPHFDFWRLHCVASDSAVIVCSLSFILFRRANLAVLIVVVIEFLCSPTRTRAELGLPPATTHFDESNKKWYQMIWMTKLFIFYILCSGVKLNRRIPAANTSLANKNSHILARALSKSGSPLTSSTSHAELM